MSNIRRFFTNYSQYNFWISPYQVGVKTQLIIQPQKFLEFQELAEETGLKYTIITEDIQR